MIKIPAVLYYYYYLLLYSLAAVRKCTKALLPPNLTRIVSCISRTIWGCRADLPVVVVAVQLRKPGKYIIKKIKKRKGECKNGKRN